MRILHLRLYFALIANATTNLSARHTITTYLGVQVRRDTNWDVVAVSTNHTVCLRITYGKNHSHLPATSRPKVIGSAFHAIVPITAHSCPHHHLKSSPKLVDSQLDPLLHVGRTLYWTDCFPTLMPGTLLCQAPMSHLLPLCPFSREDRCQIARTSHREKCALAILLPPRGDRGRAQTREDHRTLSPLYLRKHHSGAQHLPRNGERRGTMSCRQHSATRTSCPARRTTRFQLRSHGSRLPSR
jgi:hypothetical protein